MEIAAAVMMVKTPEKIGSAGGVNDPTLAGTVKPNYYKCT
jgi:hypothetical protein